MTAHQPLAGRDSLHVQTGRLALLFGFDTETEMALRAWVVRTYGVTAQIRGYVTARRLATLEVRMPITPRTSEEEARWAEECDLVGQCRCRLCVPALRVVLSLTDVDVNMALSKMSAMHEARGDSHVSRWMKKRNGGVRTLAVPSERAAEIISWCKRKKWKHADVTAFVDGHGYMRLCVSVRGCAVEDLCVGPEQTVQDAAKLAGVLRALH